MARLNNRPTNGLIPTTGEAFPNGVLLDLIRDEETKEIGLLAWDKGETRIGGQLEYAGKTYVPAAVDPTVLSALQLPTRSSPSGTTTSDLFCSIYTELARLTGLPDPILAQVICFIFTTWLVDRLPIAPFLWIVAPESADGEALLQLLALFCRRSLLLTADSIAGLWTLPMNLRPTLLLDAAELTAPMQKFLHASNHKGIYFARRGQTLNFCCAKAVSSLESLRDPGLANLALQVTLPPNRPQRSVLTQEESQKIAERYQADLLWYRLRNYGQIRILDSDLEGLPAAKQSLARSFVACILDNEKLRSVVLPLLCEQDREGEVELSSGLEAVILRALLSCCHEGDRSTLRVAELAEITNAMLRRRGERVQISPETVGWKLRSLRLRTESVANGGKGLWMLNDVRGRIHRLALEYRVPSDPQGAQQGCPFCPPVVAAKSTGGEGDDDSELLCVL
jgi:hypothetical protein